MRQPGVAIVGGGFSGVLTALHLLAERDGPQVRLIERSPVFGRGVAYATANPTHLLNVRAANMSAFPDDPDHFLRWLSSRGGWSAHGSFVTRGIYGAYLQDMLREAVREAPAGRLLLDRDEVVEARRSAAAGGWTLRTQMGRTIEADALVLATGLLPPAPPVGADAEFLASPHYVSDPWAGAERLEGLGRRVLVLGAGLTMVDVVLELSAGGRRLLALSRHGLIPQVHGPTPANLSGPPPAGGVAALVRQLRAEAAAGDWRAGVDRLRPYVQRIWSQWTPEQQGRFLRHVRPWWDIHRHRLAPAVARQVEALRRDGELTIEAGRLVTLELRRGGVAACWRPRGSRALKWRMFDAVVNCMGPLGDLGRAQAPLLRDLVERGLLRPDRWALGAEVDARSRPLGADGVAHDDFFAVGPLTRGRLWEISSVPDIRLQAASVAAAVRERLGEARTVAG